MRHHSIWVGNRASMTIHPADTTHPLAGLSWVGGSVSLVGLFLNSPMHSPGCIGLGGVFPVVIFPKFTLLQGLQPVCRFIHTCAPAHAPATTVATAERHLFVVVRFSSACKRPDACDARSSVLQRAARACTRHDAILQRRALRNLQDGVRTPPSQHCHRYDRFCGRTLCGIGPSLQL